MMRWMWHIKPLTDELDSPMWKRKIWDLLPRQSLRRNWQYVSETRTAEKCPTDAQTKLRKQRSHFYRKSNSFAKAIITSLVSDAGYQKIKDAWCEEGTEATVRGHIKNQLFKICTDFFAFGWMSGEDVSTHTAKLRSLWHNFYFIADKT